MAPVDLDSGEAVAFGRRGRRDVPISKAVQASTALPGLYRPVRIKDGDGCELRRSCERRRRHDDGRGCTEPGRVGEHTGELA